MRIRDAVEEDSALIAQVQINSYRTAYAGLLPAGYLAAFSYTEQSQDWLDLIRSGQDQLLVAADDKDGVVGYALVRLTMGEPADFDCELVALHVRAAWQRRGVGRALLSAAAHRMHASGCRTLGLWVLKGNPARQFYEHLGGQENGEQFFEINEYNLRRREVGYRWDRIEDLF